MGRHEPADLRDEAGTGADEDADAGGQVAAKGAACRKRQASAGRSITKSQK